MYIIYSRIGEHLSIPVSQEKLNGPLKVCAITKITNIDQAFEMIRISKEYYARRKKHKRLEYYVIHQSLVNPELCPN